MKLFNDILWKFGRSNLIISRKYSSYFWSTFHYFHIGFQDILIIGETGEFHKTNEREVITLKNDSISQSEIRIPTLPMYSLMSGLPMFLKNILLATKLPNGDFLLCGKPDSLLIYNSEKPEDYGWVIDHYYQTTIRILFWPKANTNGHTLQKWKRKCMIMPLC